VVSIPNEVKLNSVAVGDVPRVEQLVARAVFGSLQQKHKRKTFLSGINTIKHGNSPTYPIPRFLQGRRKSEISIWPVIYVYIHTHTLYTIHITTYSVLLQIIVNIENKHSL
jgi:hypothetical protein